MQGNLSTEVTLPAIKKFLNDGGTVITVGRATSLGFAARSADRESPDGARPGPARPRAGRREVLRAGLGPPRRGRHRRAGRGGLPSQLDVFFDNSPVFRLKPDAALKGTKAVAWFDSATPLRSGWAWGQNYLEGGASVVESSYGKGTVYLFGPEITFRGQPHGTFKFLFNGIYAPTSTPAIVP